MTTSGYHRHAEVTGTITVGDLLRLPESRERDRLIERLVTRHRRRTEGVEQWVVDAWEEAERLMVEDEERREERPTMAELAAKRHGASRT